MNQDNDHESDNVTSERRVLLVKGCRRLIYELAHSYQ